MTSFSVSTSNSATVASERKLVWEALTDPGLVTRLTPYVHSIDADGKRWTWHLVRIPLLGSMVSPSFTEVMTFEEPSRIDFAHDPSRTDEKAGVEGSYVLEDASSGTHLAIDLTISVELPFPRLARPAVHAAMHAVVATMGNRFSANLVRHLRDQR
jgi:carbon monoxide dehydrogenase subunit G